MQPAAMLSRKFDLDGNSGILSPGSAESLEVSASTDSDIVEAITTNRQFPTRPNGKIELGRIRLEADADKDIAFSAGQTKVSFKASSGIGAGVGIYDRAEDAIAALAIEEAPGLDISLPSTPRSRYLLMLWGYDVSGAANATHPIGSLGTVTFE